MVDWISLAHDKCQWLADVNFKMNIIIIIIIIIMFINCNWVVTGWQWVFYMYTK